MKKSLLKIFIFISALVFSNSVWGFTSTLKDTELLDSYNSGSKTVSWDHGHVNFSFSGNCLYMTGGKHWYGDTRILYMPNGADVRYNENTTYTLSWTSSGYDIEVTKVTINVERASGGNSYITVGQGARTGDLFWGGANISSGSEVYRNGQSVAILFEKATTWSTVDLNSITIEYNLKPQINVSDGNVEVTICDGNKKTIDLRTLAKPVVTNGHVSYSYSVESVEPAANTSATTETGHISDYTFYATQAGVYKIKISTYPATCHQAHSKTFSVTVKPAALALTAPTASDITYRQALSVSDLTGGSAKVGSCDVAGTWAWKYQETTPSIGDNQPFPVVFTPSENAGNYTGFETTALVDVKRAQFVFDGSGKEADDPNHVTWCYDDNWEENQKPGSEDKVLIDHNVVIRQEISVYSVTINEGDTLTIMPTGGLTVGAGGIIGATTGNLILKAETEGKTKGQTGYLRISPEYTGAMPEATVELFSIGYVDYELGGLSNLMAWQYVGYPIQESVKAKSIFDGWIYSWSEEDGAWKNTRKNLMLQPFEGYATTQDYETEGLLMKFEGHLVSNTTRDIPLAYSSESALPGWNAVANSFSAPIDITKMTNDDFSDGVEATIYIFNTGSTEHAEAGIEGAGQYIPIPINLANTMQEGFLLPAVIPSMQGFFVNTTKAGTMTLNYSNIVWNASHANKPLRVRTQTTENSITGALCVSVSSNGWSDNLYLLESDDYSTEYENGYDATKRMSGSLNVFAVEEEANLAVDATNSIEGTRVGVRTGEEMTYTMTFSHINSEENWMLWDKEAGFKMLLSEDVEYTFNAAPNSEITERFQIVAANIPTITTGVDEVGSETKVQKFIKDNQLYILKDGVLYNATGAVVRK